jgi:hypothetical protein
MPLVVPVDAVVDGIVDGVMPVPDGVVELLPCVLLLSVAVDAVVLPVVSLRWQPASASAAAAAARLSRTRGCLAFICCSQKRKRC